MAVPAHRIESVDWLRRDAAALAGVLPRASDVVAVRGQGSWLWDVDGRRYLDLTSGIAVTTVGHCHPRVVEAVVGQANRLMHTSVVAHLPPAIQLAERIGAMTPFMDGAQVFFCNSGAEAVDGALKLARRVTGRGGVICFRRAFHGRTLAATSLTTAKDKYRAGYEPLLPDVHVAPYGGDLEALDELLATHAPDVGAMIVEPVLGEGGYVPAPRDWLVGLRERCDRHGILLIFDEVQCGAGRTGRFWAAESYDVTPHVVLFAKGIANGMPLGGIVAPRDLMGRWPTGAHGSTFGGNPVSCAAALATIDVIERERLLPRVRKLGRSALIELRSSLAGTDDVAAVRGLGFMIGIELGSGETAARVKDRCLDQGVLVLVCGPRDDVIRLVPPLTIAPDELERGIFTLVDVIKE